MTDPIDRIRAASRQMAREWGFLRPTLAGTAYSASAVHAIVELGRRGTLTAAELVDVLGLDKSSISRLLAKLTAAGEIAVLDSDGDARAKPLVLTEKGRRTLAGIDAFARRQVTAATAHLAPDELDTVCTSLDAYAGALRAHRRGDPPAQEDVRIETGYAPGVIGGVASLHMAYYAPAVGFGQIFESRVAAAVADVTARLDRPVNQIWRAMLGDTLVGSVAIDGEGMGPGIAHLRTFIVDARMQGRGVGRRLLDAALRFCDEQGFDEIRLRTVKGLDAARHLYEQAGFHLTSETPGEHWGKPMIEQCLVRKRPA
jgi:DNA-binding MarR family transcriptional regulator/N-acetylglutamate synthase-like GNAT family acetyltransferase